MDWRATAPAPRAPSGLQSPNNGSSWRRIIRRLRLRVDSGEFGSKSVRDALRTLGPERLGVPLELRRKTDKPLLDRRVVWRAIVAEGSLDPRHRKQAGNTRHPEFREHRAQLHRG